MLSSGFIAMSASSFAAEEAQDENQAEQQDVEVIEVKGFRGSIVESISTKRYSSEVVESISAEDIGKLPDSSIAESIARLPGLAAQRLDGRASKVSIRGFGENESGTTFNGREQVSIGDNRGVEFDLYPSEVMAGVTVYKTPSASLEAEGIAGIVDMQSVKPLSQDGQVIQFNGQFEKTSFEKLNPDGDDTGFRGTFSYIDQFAGDTFGVAFAYSKMTSPNQEKRWNSWGYPEFTGPDGNNYSILGGAKPFVRSSTLNRDSAMLVLEAQPTDKLQMTLDALYVNFTDEKILRGIEVPFAWGQGTIDPDSVVVDQETGFITSAVTQGQRVVVRNDYEERDADLTSLGFNTSYQLSETFILEFDASYSAVERTIWSLESYSGTGRGDNVGIPDDIGYEFNGGNTGAVFNPGLDYGDYDLIKLGGPLTWGWSSALNEKYGIVGTPLENTAQDGFLNTPSIDDELVTLKLAAEQELDNDFVSAVKYGISHRTREKTKDSEGYFMTINSFPDTPVVPEQYRLGTVDLGFIGMGNMIAYDSNAMLRNGEYDLLAESLTNTSHASKSWQVTEEVTNAYIQADLDLEVADMPLTGNVGVRYVYTKQSSDGAASENVNGVVQTSPVSASHDYNHVLPSLNLALQITEEQTLRLGLAKTIARARLDEMNASLLTSYSQTPDSEGNYWSVSGGNIELEPKEATGLDLSYENYFSQEGYVSAALFYKKLDNWIFDGQFEVDMTGVADPNTGIVPPPENSKGTQSGKINGGNGNLWGYELSVTLPFNVFSDSLDGLGLIASHTGIESDIQDPNGNDFELPGLSDSIQNVTVYFERAGWQLRASARKRSDFKGDIYGVGFDTVQVDILGETVVDAQIGYDFGEGGFESLDGLSVFLQGYNLTKEPFTTLSGDNALQVRDYQDYGSTYLLGFSYKL